MSEIMPSVPTPPLPPLGDIGAITRRDRRAVVAHYGSAAGELAVCLRSVGIALRTDLIARTCRRGAAPAPADVLAGGGTAFEHGGWWCVAPDDRTVTVVGRPSAQIFTLAGGEQNGPPSLDTVVFNVVGPRAPAVLADLRLFGASNDPREVPPFCDAWLAGRPARVISQTLTNFLVLARAGDLDATWRALTEAGRRHGAAAVGIEALERGLLTQAGRSRLPTAV